MCCVLVFNQVLYVATLKKYDEIPLLILHILIGGLIYSHCLFLNKSTGGGREEVGKAERKKQRPCWKTKNSSEYSSFMELILHFFPCVKTKCSSPVPQSISGQNGFDSFKYNGWDHSGFFFVFHRIFHFTCIQVNLCLCFICRQFGHSVLITI